MQLGKGLRVWAPVSALCMVLCGSLVCLGQRDSLVDYRTLSVPESPPKRTTYAEPLSESKGPATGSSTVNRETTIAPISPYPATQQPPGHEGPSVEIGPDGKPILKMPRPEGTEEPAKYRPEGPEKPAIRLFGHDFFDRVTEGFQPTPDLPPPAEYPLGAGDMLRVVMSSPVGLETEVEDKVDSTGRFRLPNVGSIQVNGLTIGQAEAAISRAVRAKYPSLKTQATILSIRPIQVFVIGEVKKPGAYILPGLSTLLNALYVAGGPSDAGSIRSIRVERNRKPIATVDLYDILLHGKREKDVTLQSGDSVFIPAIGPTVTVEGEINRPAIYEILDTLSVRGAMAMAGGPTGAASLRNVRVERVLGGARKFIADLTVTSPDSPDWEFPLQHGDRLLLDPVLPDPVNAVQIVGKVRRPGTFELSDGMTVSQLVQRAEGFASSEEIYLERATILRVGPDGKSELVSTHLGKAMDGEPDQDIVLKPQDLVIIYGMSEAANLNRTVTISGLVKKPGTYDRKDGMRVRDLIIAAGGASQEAHKTVEIGRMLENGTQTQLLNVNLDRAMSGEETDNLLLADGDRVSIREVSEAQKAASTVTITGQVRYPGTYALREKGERVTSLLERAGGLTDDAFAEGAIFVRRAPAVVADRQVDIAGDIQRSQKELSDQLRELEMAKYGIAPKPKTPTVTAPVTDDGSAAAAAAATGMASVAEEVGKAGKGPTAEISLEAERTVEEVTQSTRLPIDMLAGIKEPDGPDDLPLEDGDTIVIPKRPLVVSVAGAVVNPSVVLYREGLRVEDYIRQVGGYARDSDAGNTVVVRASGLVRRQREAGPVQLGDIILVPPKALTAPKNQWEQIADISRVIGSIALTILVATD